MLREAWKSDWLSKADDLKKNPAASNLLTVRTSFMFLGCFVLKEINHLVTAHNDKCFFSCIPLSQTLYNKNKRCFAAFLQLLPIQASPPSPPVCPWFTPKAITDMLNRSSVDLRGVTRVDAYGPHGPQPAHQASRRASQWGGKDIIKGGQEDADIWESLCCRPN